MKVLISTWGNPRGWGEVEYLYKDKCEKAKDPSRLIKNKENIDKTIIISVDTLADESIPSSDDRKYEKIKKSAEEIIRDFYWHEFKEEPNKIIISYGVGEFNKSKFIGNAMDFYFSILKELSFTLLEWLEEDKSNRRLEIYLDISHGMNFVPVLTYRALKEILQIFAYIFETKFVVLNSDTFIRSEKPLFLNINEIENGKIIPKITIYQSDKKMIEPYTNLKNEEKKEMAKKLLEDFSIDDKILCFLSSFMYGMPVLVINYIPNIENLKTKIEKTIKKFEEEIKIEINFPSKWVIKRNLEFRINFENLVKAYLVSWLLRRCDISQKTEVEIEEIQEIKKKIWKSNFPAESNRIDVEIKDIKKIKSISSNWKPYYEILGNQGSNINERNFFAHAGFEHNTIEIKKDDDKIKIRIYKDNEEEIKNYLKKNLPRSEYA
ncbi:MAG: CRISPR-associated CARF protein Csx1 [Candidatus Micrarchaeia archaeon]